MTNRPIFTDFQSHIFFLICLNFQKLKFYESVWQSGLSSHMNRTGHANCRKIDAQPNPGSNGNGSNFTSTQITRKVKSGPKIPNRATKRTNGDLIDSSFG